MQRDNPVLIWNIESQKSDSAISHIIAGNLNGIDGSTDIMIAWDDGSVEIYNFDSENKPSLWYQINFQESITGLGIGKISN